MQATRRQWTMRLAAGMAAATLAAAVMARDDADNDDGPDACPPPAIRGHGALAEPELPSLRGVKLSEAQRDKLFELALAQAPARHALARQAARSHEDLRRAAASDPFDEARVRALAEMRAQAMARLLLMRAELDAKARALLTPEQRSQLKPAPCPPPP
ncbi:Spy/CpxP family protein refolding chaperone [Chromobacterium vaccinii]|uniref:Spy/CpxP family protein refolding chaperone n=1 Tax=Chromobacterium vaccinii TaxID=1108595 RepID=UPI003C76A51A